MKIADKTVVTIDYTLKDDDGEVIDTSEGAQPLSYLHGANNIVPGLENALSGSDPGDHINVDVSAAEGYGEYDEQMVYTVEKSRLPQDTPLQTGMQFQAETPAGARILTLTKLSDTEATLDANHPLAGRELHFDVWVRDVRRATSEEMSHGHVHD